MSIRGEVKDPKEENNQSSGHVSDEVVDEDHGL